MAAYTWTATNVVAPTGTSTSSGKISASVVGAILPGQPITVDSSNEIIKADASALANIFIALSEGVAGQVIAYAVPGSTITYGAAVFDMTDPLIVLGNTAGELYPYADATTGDQLIIIGWATSATTMFFRGLITPVVLT